MRTLPWTYPSITQQTSALDTSALAPGDVDKNPRNVDNGSTGLILFEVITGFGTSTANLRALGSANTLVLIDGRRIAGRAGDEEGYANLLNVPFSAIERVDVQLDGGSAVYGADAIGGVINFITKKNYTGGEVNLRRDFSSTGADRTNASIRGGYGWQVGYIRPNLLPDADPAKDRVVELLASSDPAVAINLFGDGSKQSPHLGELASPWIGPHRGATETTNYGLLLRGQLFELPGGRIGYAAGMRLREKRISLEQEDYSDASGTETKGLEILFGVERPTEDLTAYFAEFAFPIVGPDNARPGLHSLLLNVQARHDRYEATGAFGGVTRVRESGVWVHKGEPNIITLTPSHTSPRFGLRYGPTENLALRASWSESFRPPVFSDTFHVIEPREDTVYVADPYDVPGGPTCLVFGCQVRREVIYSVGDDLRPETADHYSFGFEWTPEALPGLLWTMHWSKIDFTDKIEYSYNLLFSAPEVAFKLPEIIERDADGNAIKAFARQINLSEKVSEILTTELEYSFAGALGTFRPRLSYTRVLDEHFTIIPGSPPVDRAGTTGGSNEYGLVGSLAWTAGKYAADLFVYYTPSYLNDRTGTCPAQVGACERAGVPRPPMTVDSYVTVDVTASYRFENGIRLRGGGRNVLDADPPATPWGGLPYDLTRYDARGQRLFMEINWDLLN